MQYEDHKHPNMNTGLCSPANPGFLVNKYVGHAFLPHESTHPRTRTASPVVLGPMCDLEPICLADRPGGADGTPCSTPQPSREEGLSKRGETPRPMPTLLPLHKFWNQMVQLVSNTVCLLFMFIVHLK